MTRSTLRRTVAPLAIPLLSLAWLAAAPAPERTKVAGTFTMKYAQQQMLPVGSQEGHALILGESRGSNRSTGKGAYMDGAETVNVETADLTQGNGPHQGYLTFSKDGESTLTRWNGKVTTILAEDKTPRTSFEGSWTKVSGTGQYEGIRGSGKYKGHFTAKDQYVVNWEGEISTNVAAR